MSPFKRQMQEGTIKSLEEYVGRDALQQIMQNENTSRTFLGHQNPKIRFAVLALFGIVWDTTEEIADICEEIALSDSDATVRTRAVGVLMKFYATKNDARIGRLLAKIACDQAENVDVRKAAYEGLFWMPQQVRLPLPTASGYAFPEDVDWAFVNSFRNAD